MQAQKCTWFTGRQTLLIAFSMVLAATEFALANEIKVNHQVKVRQKDSNSPVLKTVGLLPPGTLVQVPEGELRNQYKLLESSESEELLMEWLLRAGKIFEFEDKKGEVKKDYFFPVEVVSSSSKSIQKGSIVFVPIRYLVEKQGIELVTDEAADVVALQSPGENAWKFSLSDLKSRLSENSRYIEVSKRQTFLTRRFHEDFKLKPNCPVSDEEFLQVAYEAADYNKVPKELVLSLLEMESSGDCLALRDEINGSQSVGLFQLNTNSTDIPTCNTEQLNQLKTRMTVSELSDPGLQCLQNPVTNLHEAISSLRTKYSRVNLQKQPSILQWDMMDKRARDDWRKAIAAYNGGEAYVYQGFNDVKSINETFGLQLDPDDWEVRRLFMMRNMLKPDEQNKIFRHNMKFSRHKRLTYINIIYVETIAGREHRDVFAQTSIVSKWLNHLYDIQGIQLAAEDKTKTSCWFCKENFAFLYD